MVTRRIRRTSDVREVEPADDGSICVIYGYVDEIKGRRFIGHFFTQTTEGITDSTVLFLPEVIWKSVTTYGISSDGLMNIGIYNGPDGIKWIPRQ